LAAKCIKVCFDKTLQESICNGIQIYHKLDDDVTCELIFAITDFGDFDYFSDKRIVAEFKNVLKYGGNQSQSIILNQFNLYKENIDKNFEW